jgi:hypothetical protein
MEALAQILALYHSEADFQHAFAWELHRASPECDIRLEAPIRTSSGSTHLDLLVRSPAGEVAIELKYKTRALAIDLQGEQFNLVSHSAQDLGRYDFFKDLRRVEAFAASAPNRSGYAIFLTNDSAYWKSPGSLAYGYAAFTMHDGRAVSGSLGWGERASEGTRKGRQSDIELYGNYGLSWAEYSSVPADSYGNFRYLCVHASAV